jgi:hypothetical protein
VALAPAPRGEWVKRGMQLNAHSSPHDEAPRGANWATSSFELLDGVTVIETSDVVSVALPDRFFEKPGQGGVG